jgi:hypothetical protein
MVKTLLVFLLLAFPALSQNSKPVSNNGGCGPAESHFDVTTQKTKPPALQPEPGKALVYVIEDIERGPTMRVGVDGAWLGANKGRSYLSVPVEPGEHQFCTNWQSGVFKETARRIGSAVSLSTEAGKIYYLRVQVYERSEKDSTVKLEPVETAEGQFLVSSAFMSTSRPKK